MSLKRLCGMVIAPCSTAKPLFKFCFKIILDSGISPYIRFKVKSSVDIEQNKPL